MWLAVAALGLVLGATPALADSMSFSNAVLSAPAGCRKRCGGLEGAQVIVASGEITNSTADDFVTFLREHADEERERPVVLIHSPGGTVVGAMQLGLDFRKLGASVIVARVGADPETGRVYAVRGACMSACVYAFFGGVRRVVPASSALGIHRMAIYGSEHDPAGGSITTRSFGTEDIVSALASYTRLMGVDPTVIDYAEQIDPKSIHIVTAREMAHWHMASSR